jgi:integrase
VADLTRKGSRERLTARREPYWQRLAAGAYLGFRRGPDTWVARFRGRDHKQQYRALGEAIEYDEAKRRAEAWLSQLTASPVRVAKRGTVRAALEAYIEDLRRHGRGAAGIEGERRFKSIVWSDPIATTALESLTLDDMLEWRDRLRPGRQDRSVNRHVRSVVAGLNRARRLGHVGNREAWQLIPLSDDVEDEGDTAVYLSSEQRSALIAAASPAAASFLRGLELTGARPSELAAARVSDLYGDTLRLAHRKGRPPRLRTRAVVLSPDGARFFATQARTKLPGASLFTEDGASSWRRHIWAREVRAAIVRHNAVAEGGRRIDPRASAYSFRHARISELLQVYGVDPLTVASQTGTSLAMIERSYLKFIPSAIREKLATVRRA